MVCMKIAPTNRTSLCTDDEKLLTLRNAIPHVYLVCVLSYGDQPDQPAIWPTSATHAVAFRICKIVYISEVRDTRLMKSETVIKCEFYCSNMAFVRTLWIKPKTVCEDLRRFTLPFLIQSITNIQLLDAGKNIDTNKSVIMSQHVLSSRKTTTLEVKLFYSVENSEIRTNSCEYVLIYWWTKGLGSMWFICISRCNFFREQNLVPLCGHCSCLCLLISCFFSCVHKTVMWTTVVWSLAIVLYGILCRAPVWFDALFVLYVM